MHLVSLCLLASPTLPQSSTDIHNYPLHEVHLPESAPKGHMTTFAASTRFPSDRSPPLPRRLLVRQHCQQLQRYFPSGCLQYTKR